MITPALELQGAPQRIDRMGPETATADSGGDFGAAFAASLSATPASAGSSGLREVADDVGQKLATPGQPGGSSRTSASTTTTASSKFVSTSVRQKSAVATAASLHDSAEDEGIDAIQQTQEAVASSVATRSAVSPAKADAVFSGRSGAQQTTDTSAVLSEAQKIALARAEALGHGLEDVQDLASVASQPLDASGSGSGLKETAKALQSSSRVEGSQSATKSKGSGQAPDKTASQIALPSTGAVTHDVPVAALAAVAPTESSRTISESSSASSLKRADGITAASGAASAEFSAPFGQQHWNAAQSGAGTAKSGALAAWNSIEPVNASAARDAAGKTAEFSATYREVESASEVQPSAEIAPSAAEYPETGLLASGLDRSTAASVSTAFTISGEQRVPSIANDLSKEASDARSGLPGGSPLRSVSANISLNGSQPTGASSTALLAADARPDSATVVSTLSKTTDLVSSINNLTANSARTGAARSGVSGRPLATPGSLAATKQISQPSATLDPSQNAAALPDAASKLSHTDSASLEHKSSDAQRVAGAATLPGPQRSTVADSSAASRAKAIGSVGAASQPALAASTLGSESSTDRGVSGDGSGNGVSAHAVGFAAATTSDHIAPPESFNGAGVAGAATSTLSIQGVHQGTGNISGSSAFPGPGAVSGPGSLSAATQVELGHPINTLGSAIASEPHQTLVATPTSLEVGVHSGSQGWLKIRAEVGGEGEVSASLAAASPSDEQMLKGQLPALNAYLHSEQMSVTTSVAERAGISHGAMTHDAGGSTLQAGTSSSSGQNASLLDGGASQGMAGHGGRSQSDAGSATPVQTPSPGDGQTVYEASSDTRVTSEGSVLPSITADSSGQWLNVRV